MNPQMPHSRLLSAIAYIRLPSRHPLVRGDPVVTTVRLSPSNGLLPSVTLIKTILFDSLRILPFAPSHPARTASASGCFPRRNSIVRYDPFGVTPTGTIVFSAEFLPLCTALLTKHPRFSGNLRATSNPETLESRCKVKQGCKPHK